MPIAITLSAHRNGRAAMLPQNICSSEKGPSKVSFIREIQNFYAKLPSSLQPQACHHNW
jgi:hypothetical protein